MATKIDKRLGSKFTKHIPDILAFLYLGATPKEIQRIYGCSRASITTWQKLYAPDLIEKRKQERYNAQARAASAAYYRSLKPKHEFYQFDFVQKVVLEYTESKAKDKTVTMRKVALRHKIPLKTLHYWTKEYPIRLRNELAYRKARDANFPILEDLIRNKDKSITSVILQPSKAPKTLKTISTLPPSSIVVPKERLMAGR